MVLGRTKRQCTRAGTALRLPDQAGCGPGKGGAFSRRTVREGGASQEAGLGIERGFASAGVSFSFRVSIGPELPWVRAGQTHTQVCIQGK